MDLGSFLRQTTEQLQAAGIDSARLDTLILLEDVLSKDRSSLLAHPEIQLSPGQLSILNTYITQRKQHIPLAYIRGKASFYGRDFTVTTNTLTPRPETESIINLAKSIPVIPRVVIADIGTGSGCIGITAALEITDSRVYVYDTSVAALKVAADNAQRHHVSIHIAEQDLLEHDTHDYDIVLANLPYVPDDYIINKAATHEPRQALFSGNDGLDHYRRFWQQIAALKNQPRHVILESLLIQHPLLASYAKQTSYNLYATQGLVQHFTFTEEAHQE